MSILADSSSPPKQLSEIGDFNRNNGFPCNDAFRSSGRKCRAAPAPTPAALDCSNIAPANASSYVKCSKLNLTRDFADISGKSEFSGIVKKPRFSSGEAIAAVPLRILRSSDVKRNTEKTGTSRGKDDDVGGKLAINIDNTVGQQEKSWECELEKLAAVIAEAQKFLGIIDGKNSVSKRVEVDQEGKPFGVETEGEDDEEEVCVLSPAEWRSLYHKGDGAKASVGKTEEKIENGSSHKSGGEFQNMAESQGTEPDQQVEVVSDCELTETKSGEEHQEQGYADIDSKCSGNRNELINLRIGKHEQPQHSDVMETLKLFDQQYIELNNKRTSEFREGKFPKPAYTEAGERVKAMGKCISVEMPFGHIPGIEIGDKFRFRTELALVGLHRQLVSGISYVCVHGKKCATSVVDSGQYENTANTDRLIYSGQGGNPKFADGASDQKLERGNLALVNSRQMEYPVRVIFKRRNLRACTTLGTSDVREFVYVYDGLYTVNDHWQERGENGKWVYKFELLRLLGQPRPRETNVRLGKPIKRMDVCVRNDLSQGKEIFPIRAMNGVDDDPPPLFTYITKIIYPNWYQHVEPIGCNCTNGCSDSKKCACVLKNGDEIPFNEDGAILRVMPRVYECGPSCKCPPSCMNRVSQHGPYYQLEIFKTESRGWGVRSRDNIKKGSFICEYVGELLQEKEAEKRIGNDEYLFDICKSHDEGEQEEENGFALDAAKFGNIGRFINHSCSPNLFGQEVLYDHDDKRMPHIMFFASRNIRPSQELTYDYNYKDPVCDANGNTKIKNCYCGSRQCTGRMY
ncbi:hypothetical protein ACS0TY_001206 [Phlomoides rotata]